MIGKRAAAAVVGQEDMSLVGVADVVTDWRARMVTGVALCCSAQPANTRP